MGDLNAEKIRSEISTCDERLSEFTGQKINLFRPPYGDYNNSVINIAKELNYFTIQWDVDSLDWKPGITEEEILKRVSSRVNNGSIILFHNDTKHTAVILPDILKALRMNGYGFLPVSKLIMKGNYYIDYTGRQKSR
jgi:peptidoglycan/xylan/chitin deacetylase (PgdA/CDA1 family)